MHLYSRNILRMVISFLLWYLAYVVTTPRFLFSVLHGQPSIALIKLDMPGHLWYLFFAICLYVLIPILRSITASRDLTKYVLALTLVAGGALPTLLDIPFLQDFGTVTLLRDNLYGAYGYQLGMGYFAYFVVGYALSTCELTPKRLRLFILAGCLGFAYTVAMTVSSSVILDTKTQAYFNYCSLNILGESCSVFYATRYAVEKHTLSPQLSTKLAMLSDSVFGIYLIHMRVINLVCLVVEPLKYNSLFMTGLMVASVFIISYLSTRLIRRIPIAKDWIV